MKLCVNCANFLPDMTYDIPQNRIKHGGCARLKRGMDAVVLDGQPDASAYENALRVRHDPAKCGLDAQWFEPR